MLVALVILSTLRLLQQSRTNGLAETPISAVIPETNESGEVTKIAKFRVELCNEIGRNWRRLILSEIKFSFCYPLAWGEPWVGKAARTGYRGQTVSVHFPDIDRVNSHIVVLSLTSQDFLEPDDEGNFPSGPDMCWGCLATEPVDALKRRLTITAENVPVAFNRIHSLEKIAVGGKTGLFVREDVQRLSGEWLPNVAWYFPAAVNGGIFNLKMFGPSKETDKLRQLVNTLRF